MNRKIVSRISALVFAAVMGITGIFGSINAIDAMAGDIDDIGAVYAADGHKVINLDIAGNHYPDTYKYIREHGYDTTNPGTYIVDISGRLDNNFPDKTYKDYYNNPQNNDLIHKHSCMQYVVCRVHELTGIWLDNKHLANRNDKDLLNPGGGNIRSVRPRKYSMYFIEFKDPEEEMFNHTRIVEDVDTKNHKMIESENASRLFVSNYDKKKQQEIDKTNSKGDQMYYIYFGNAVAKKRIKDHIKECGDHIIYTTVKAPTCTKKGAKIATCSKCGWVCDPAIEVAPTHHKYVKSFDGIKQPITLGDYKAKYVCEDCGRTLHRKTYTINDIRTIDRKSHYHDKKADEIYIGVNTTSIGDNAFNGCTNVSYIEIDSKKLKSIGKNAFKNTGKNQFRNHRWAGGSVTFERLTVYIPAKQFKKYKKMLLKAGIDKRTEFKKLHGSVKHMAEEDEAGVVEGWDDENDDGTIVEVR